MFFSFWGYSLCSPRYDPIYRCCLVAVSMPSEQGKTSYLVCLVTANLLERIALFLKIVCINTFDQVQLL